MNGGCRRGSRVVWMQIKHTLYYSIELVIHCHSLYQIPDRENSTLLAVRRSTHVDIWSAFYKNAKPFVVTGPTRIQRYSVALEDGASGTCNSLLQSMKTKSCETANKHARNEAHY